MQLNSRPLHLSPQIKWRGLANPTDTWEQIPYAKFGSSDGFVFLDPKGLQGHELHVLRWVALEVVIDTLSSIPGFGGRLGYQPICLLATHFGARLEVSSNLVQLNGHPGFCPVAQNGNLYKVLSTVGAACAAGFAVWGTGSWRRLRSKALDCAFQATC
jgi:hypothetical protein